MNRYFTALALGMLMLTGCNREPGPSGQPRRIFISKGSVVASEAYGSNRIPPAAFPAEGLEKLLDEIIAASSPMQFLELQDSEHSFPEHKEFLSSEITIRKLAAAGYKNIFLEFPVIMQKYADEFYEGSISRQLFNGLGECAGSTFVARGESEHRRTFEARADMIEIGKRYGIKVHFVDVEGGRVRGTPQEISTVNKIFKTYMEEVKKYLNENPEYFKIGPYKGRKDEARKILNAVITEKFSKEEADIYRRAIIQPSTPEEVIAFTQERFAKDKDVAALIRKIAKGDKSVYMYGAAHSMFLGMGIDDALGHKNVYRITLWANPALKAERTQPQLLQDAEEVYGRKIEFPDADIILSSLSWVPRRGVTKFFGAEEKPRQQALVP